MFDRLISAIKVSGLRRALQKRAPDRIAIDSEANCYVPFLTNRKAGEKFLVGSIEGSAIKGFKTNGIRYEVESEVGLSELDDWEVQITRFYGYLRIESSSIWDFWWSECSGQAQRAWVWERLSQAIYNRKLKFRDDRIDVLKKFVEIDISD